MGLLAAQLLSAAFLAILFLQSGLDKVLDWKGNRAYLEGYFAKSFLRSFVWLLFPAVTVLEVTAGVLSAAGVLSLAVTRSPQLAFLGAAVASSSLLGLFLGMRLARDYASAAGLVPYLIAAVGAVLVLGS
jgi:uncharacterized membrane protein YphA (DoxX/SURF4 family)